jgi:hypothetical protein
MALDSVQYLREIKNRDPKLGLFLENLHDSLNTSLNHLGMSATGLHQPPDPIAALNVAAGSDHVHVTLTDASEVKKAAHYFVEYSVNDPTFAQPHVEHLGASRGRVLALPAKDGLGAAQTYYFRAYSQYPGSDPQSKHIYFGTRGAPTAVMLTGSSQLTLLPSTGSGTGRADGTEGGSGFGSVLTRPSIQPKRWPVPRVT